MPELVNSQRRIFTATYAPVQPKNTPDDVEQHQKVQRAWTKISFIRSLAIRQPEIIWLRESVQGAVDHSHHQEQLLGALEVVALVISDTTAASMQQYAPVLGRLDHHLLVEIGQLLAQSRRSMTQEVENTLEGIRARYTAARRLPTEVPVAASLADGSASILEHAPPQLVTKAPQPSLSSASHLSTAIAPPAYWMPPSRAEGVPSVEDALEWAALHEPEPINRLNSLARMLSPVAPIFSRLPLAAQVAALLPQVMAWPKWTLDIVDGFIEQMQVEPIGRLHLERLQMTPVGIEHGELVYSLPLAPKETVNISHKEWALHSEEFEKIVQDQLEQFSEQGVTEKNDLSQSTTSQSTHAQAFTLSASGSYYGVSISTGYNSSSGDTQTQADSRNRSINLTRNASSRARKDHKYSFKVSSVAGTEDQAVRVITNPSETAAMRVDYYQLMRKWRVDLYRYGLRLTYDIVIPNPGAELIQQVEDIRELDRLIELPFEFKLPLTAVTAGTTAVTAGTTAGIAGTTAGIAGTTAGIAGTTAGIAGTTAGIAGSWTTYANAFNANVEPPPENPKWLHVLKGLPTKSLEESKLIDFDALEFDVDEDYEVESAFFSASYSLWKDHESSSFFNVELDEVGPAQGKGGYRSHLQYLTGKSGRLSAVYDWQYVPHGILQATLRLKPKEVTMQRWQLKAWSAMRDAAEEKYFQDRQTLVERRTKLVEELGKWDALTLRQMEREAVMKGVLRWLFGPEFDFVPPDVQHLFDPTDPDDPAVHNVLNPNTLSNQEWGRVLAWGEFIKFIHQAVEWENVLYFTYPYFWDSSQNWDLKRFLDHPDALHRTFLRAGSVRVVLTIRPGFEDAFTALLETGAFGELVPDHPYRKITDEIKSFAQTNYPGIPPANPADHENDEDVVEKERGILIGSWYEYTPTSALDISIDTNLGNLA